jgi:hypothetical protein
MMRAVSIGASRFFYVLAWHSFALSLPSFPLAVWALDR